VNLTGRPISIIYGLLLAACACLATYQLFGMMFAMGESEESGLLATGFLILTALGIAGLALAALGYWTKHPFFPLAAMVGLVGVLPEALIYLRQSPEPTIWQWNSPLVAASGIFAFMLDIAAGLWSWFRYRQLVRKVPPPANPSFN